MHVNYMGPGNRLVLWVLEQKEAYKALGVLLVWTRVFLLFVFFLLITYLVHPVHQDLGSVGKVLYRVHPHTGTLGIQMCVTHWNGQSMYILYRSARPLRQTEGSSLYNREQNKLFSSLLTSEKVKLALFGLQSSALVTVEKEYMGI